MLLHLPSFARHAPEQYTAAFSTLLSAKHLRVRVHAVAESLRQVSLCFLFAFASLPALMWACNTFSKSGCRH